MTTTETHPILAVQDLTVQYRKNNSLFYAVQGVSFAIQQNETMALVGESGSGKSSLALALLGLLQQAKVSGEVFIDDTAIYRCDIPTLRELRRKNASFVFQNPESGLLPHRRIGRQLVEVVRWRTGVDQKLGQYRATEWLQRVGLQVSEVWNQYPRELSGGMCQRVLLAMALCIHPKLVIADEPTSSLDALNQEKILALLHDLQQTFRFAMLFITHDMRIARHFADAMAVMRAGQLVETGTVKDIFNQPQKEYTRQLIASARNISI